jgi:hypothetical protein
LPAFFFNIIFCLLLCTNAFAQFTITGKVLHEITGVALPGVSVYLNNTSLGTTTNEAGEFTLRNVISGELVISSVGYERITYRLHPGGLAGPFIFKLNVKQSTLRDVLMLSDAARKRYLKLFITNFLGLTEEAQHSDILNLNAIDFSAAAEKNAFIAYADTPLTIINRKLGYIIKFDLVEFYLNEKTGQTFFYGFTRYEDMGDKKRWIANRRKAYYGSSLHFLRSLIGNKLDKENYKIFILRQDTIRGNQPRIVEVGVPTTAANIISIDSNNNKYEAKWKGILMAQYYKDPASKSYLSRRIFIPGNIPIGTRSYLKLNGEAVGIDKYGLLDDPMKVFFSGYWAYEKAANLLPYNYIPEAD